jgi:hypothetical protein
MQSAEPGNGVGENSANLAKPLHSPSGYDRTGVRVSSTQTYGRPGGWRPSADRFDSGGRPFRQTNNECSVKGGDAMIDPHRLAALLLSYEADEPHDEDEENPYYPDFTLSKLIDWRAMEHHGDCVGNMTPCCRCAADAAVRKAQWLAERLNYLENEVPSGE